jgi:cell division protein FtsQ
LPKLVRGEVLLDEETRQRINRAHFRRTMAILGALAIVGLLVLVYLSPLLRVQNVQVTGAVNLTPDQVQELVASNGQSMFRVDTDAAESRILENTLVRSVSIERSWPNTLKVTLVERTPWASWQIGEKTYIIDSEGRVLPDVPAPAGPVIHHVDATNSPAQGERVDTAAIGLALLLIDAVPARLQIGITGMEWSSTAGMTLATDAGYRVVIGDGDDLEYKLSVWSQIDASVGRDEMNGRTLDLRFGDRPSLR